MSIALRPGMVLADPKEQPDPKWKPTHYLVPMEVPGVGRWLVTDARLHGGMTIAAKTEVLEHFVEVKS